MKGTDLWVDHHLGWVAIHLTQVLLGFRALDHELLAVAPDHAERVDVQLRIDQVEELLHVPQQFLTDALAGAVDAELHARRAEQDRRGEQADGDGLADCGVCVS